jgi:glutaredoxin 3
MSKIEIYTTPICPYCHAAKRLLDEKQAGYTEINVAMDSAARAAMIERAQGRHTVPQIFIDGQHIGGCDDLYALDAQGDLTRLLSQP